MQTFNREGLFQYLQILENEYQSLHRRCTNCVETAKQEYYKGKIYILKDISRAVYNYETQKDFLLFLNRAKERINEKKKMENITSFQRKFVKGAEALVLKLYKQIENGDFNNGII